MFYNTQNEKGCENMKEEKSMTLTNQESNIVNNIEINYETENIKNLIYTIREKQVILDSDVAMLYHCETRIINQAVKRNIERFPEKFCFKLTAQEYINLKSQNVISSLTKVNSYGGRRKTPIIFTEQGIAMLSGLLKNEIAIQVSINIMDAFVEMRKFISSNGQVFERLTNIEYKLLEHDQKFDIIFNENKKNSSKKYFSMGKFMIVIV